MSGLIGGGPLGASDRRDLGPPVEIEVGPAVRAWLLRLAVLLTGASTVALLGADLNLTTGGWVLGAITVLPLVVAPRSVSAAAFVLGAAALLLRSDQPDPLVLAGAVLAVHLTLAVAWVVEALPLGALVPLAALRRRVPTFVVAQVAGQACAAVAWAVRDVASPLPWLAVAALTALAVLAWWLLRTVPRDER